MSKIFTLLVGGVLLLGSGCASIVSKSSYPILITTRPEDASITITDDRNRELYYGEAPTVVTLAASSGYFRKAAYNIRVEAPGYPTRTIPLEYKLDGWYFGNILFGGFLGLLVVDPLTGAMFRPKSDMVLINLERHGRFGAAEEIPRLEIVPLSDIPVDERVKLRRVYP